jgi:hypothetical protein
MSSADGSLNTVNKKLCLMSISARGDCRMNRSRLKDRISVLYHLQLIQNRNEPIKCQNGSLLNSLESPELLRRDSHSLSKMHCS